MVSMRSCLINSRFGMLGSVDSNTGSPDLGWDTDQFPMDIKNCALVMKVCSKRYFVHYIKEFLRCVLTKIMSNIFV